MFYKIDNVWLQYNPANQVLSAGPHQYALSIISKAVEALTPTVLSPEVSAIYPPTNFPAGMVFGLQKNEIAITIGTQNHSTTKLKVCVFNKHILINKQ